MFLTRPEDGGSSRDRRGLSRVGSVGGLTHFTTDGVAGVDGRAAGLRSARVAVRVARGRLGGMKKWSFSSLKFFQSRAC
jgi:hypothetical protein